MGELVAYLQDESAAVNGICKPILQEMGVSPQPSRQQKTHLVKFVKGCIKAVKPSMKGSAKGLYLEQ